MNKILLKMPHSGVRLLESWKYDVDFHWSDTDVANAKGKIVGYLNACVHMGVISGAEAIQLLEHFTEGK